MIGLASHLVHVRDGRHLLVRRGGTRYRPGWLSCVAGRAEPGECPKRALVREIEEEIGLVVAPEDLRFSCVVHNLVGDVGWASFFFALDRLPGEPRVREPEKILEIGWFDLERVRRETVPYVAAALGSEEQYLALTEDIAEAFAPLTLHTAPRTPPPTAF